MKKFLIALLTIVVLSGAVLTVSSGPAAADKASPGWFDEDSGW
jgi:hypothetical protein